jgi:hypothetical protein
MSTVRNLTIDNRANIPNIFGALATL